MPAYTPALKAEYEALYTSATVRPERIAEIDAVVQRIATPVAWSQYKDVERSTGVPAHVVGIVHIRESSGSFTTHLHNGDPLSRRTVHVPAGRPIDGDPPFTWAESAIDALTMPGQGLDRWEDWSIGGMCFVLEKYNGFGYRNHRINSPYLWSYTTAYERGMYVADGQWSATAVNKSPGGMAMLRRLVANGTVSLLALDPGVDPPVDPAPTPPVAVTPIETIKRVQTVLGVVSDGAFGRRSRAKLNEILIAAGQPGL